MLSLKTISSNGLGHGKVSIELLKKIYDNFVPIAKGEIIENFPEITDSISGFDLLVFAETLRSTMMAFLTPEEAEEHNKSFGFRKNNT